MTRKPVLIRNYSAESEEAESILSEHGVEYARFFDNERHKPRIISSYGTYEGAQGARRFVRVVQNGNSQSEADS